MKLCLLTVLFMTGLLFFGCREHRVDLEIGENDAPLAFDEYVESVSMIKIAETDDMMIADISKAVMIDDSTYIVMDRRQRALLKMTRGGKIVDKFQRIGRGPGEYTEIFDFDIDTNNGRLFLLCNRLLSRIMIMDFDFKMERSVDMDDRSLYQRIAYFEKEWYLYSHDAWTIYKWDEHDKPTPVIQSERSNKGVFFSHVPVFHKNGNELYVNMGGDDAVYQMKNGRGERFYTLNWHDKEAGYHIVSQLSPDDNLGYAKNAPPIIQSLIIDDKKIIIFYSRINFRMAVADIDTGRT